VAEKWLKDCKGRTITHDDLEHYHNTVAALVEAVPIVQVEQPLCRLTAGGQRLDVRAHHAKVASPCLPARVVERNDPSCEWI
jgi:hypothetical protein